MLKCIKIIALCLFLFSGNSEAQNVSIPSNDAIEWGNKNGQELLLTLGIENIIEKHAKLDEMMSKHVNLDYISKFVLGKYYKRMNKSQKLRYSEIFKRYIFSIYKQFNLTINPNDINFTIDKVTEHKNFTNIKCNIDVSKISSNNENAEKINIDFKLIRGEENRIQAVDLVISDVSLVVEYRKRFYKMVLDEDEDMDWFLDKLEDITKANEETFGRKTIKNLQMY